MASRPNQPVLLVANPSEVEDLAQRVADTKSRKDAAKIRLERARADHKDANGAYTRALEAWGSAKFGDNWTAPQEDDDEPDDSDANVIEE